MVAVRPLEPTPLPDRLPEAAPDHAALLEKVADDARREPARYLQDSIVPEGGE